MQSASLAGRSILVAEDEPLIALNIQEALEAEGARVILVRTLGEALYSVEDPRLSAAVMDHGLGTDDTSAVCARMKQLHIPYVVYSGYDDLPGADAEAVHVGKPAGTSVLVATIARLLANRSSNSSASAPTSGGR
jgi:DNA-binding response OmpR family regulator